MQDWTAQAGLPKGRTQHGIRKGAAGLLAKAGATQYEIMSLMAYTQAKTSEVYTERVERAASWRRRSLGSRPKTQKM